MERHWCICVTQEQIAQVPNSLCCKVTLRELNNEWIYLNVVDMLAPIALR